MATASVSTPLKSHHGIFSTRTAGGRVPLTPSPRTRTTSLATQASGNSSPFTPPQRTSEGIRAGSSSTYGGNLTAHFSRSTSKPHRDSPKSNIARNSPRRLELGVSDWNLMGTGLNVKQTPSKEKSRKEGALRTKSTK